MFWRFGFHNASAIDTLLDKDDVALEAILDEDDLLQECKAQNTRLIDYFQRIDVLRRLLGYVTGEIEGEDRGRFKYPYVATEVLCSEIWSIVESCVNNGDELLSPFWDSVLDRSADDMKTRTVMASQFAKINAVFLNKKPVEMFEFIRSQPRVIERIVAHIETPSFVDLLVRIIQLDEQPGGGDVLEWLSNENLMSRLVNLLSPSNSPDIHNVVSELIKGIILMSAPAPPNGASNDLSPPASNRFARQLVSQENITKLIAYLFDEFPIDPPRDPAEIFVDTPLDSSDPPHVVPPSSGSSERSPSPPPTTLPNVTSATSSLIHSISIMIELIRKNNSDYFEPYLFHTLRNRLIHIQQQQQLQREDSREALELAMNEMVERMGVVHLGGLLSAICERLDGFQALLKKPRSMNGPVPTTIGPILPLTFERFRICELYAELLHCSNMSLLNRPPGYGPVYDSEGRLQGGLSALEELARVIAGSNDSRGAEDQEDDAEGIHEARELPVAGQHPHPPSRDYDEDEDEDSDDSISDDDSEDDSGSSREEEQHAPETGRLGHHSRQPSGTDLTPPVTPPALPGSPTPPLMLPSSPNPHLTSSPSSSRASKTPSPSHTASRKGSMNLRASGSRGNSHSGHSTVSEAVGDRLKRRYLELNVASTLLDLFFEFPWNNFLHNVVYDFLHQILSGRVDRGYNRELVIALFRDCRLTTRIVDGQRANDTEIERPKGVRLGYMGHLTLISEDVVGALEHYPPELLTVLRQFVPQPDWDEYVHGRFRETKTKDTSLLGGGRPILTPGSARPGAGWGKVDESDGTPAASAGRAAASSEGTASTIVGAGPTPITSTWRPGSTSKQTADFGSTEDDLDQDGSVPTQFSQYLAQQLSSVGDSSLSESDDDDDDGEWISRSSTDFPVTGSRPAASSSMGFDDSFSSSTRTGNISFDDAFNPGRDEDEDAGFGPFSDSAATTVFSEIDEDSPFDFGDFQSSEADGETTPTAGSWTFEDSRSSGSSGHVSGEDSETKSEELRTRLEKVSLERDDGVGTPVTKTNPK